MRNGKQPLHSGSSRNRNGKPGFSARGAEGGTGRRADRGSDRNADRNTDRNADRRQGSRPAPGRGAGRASFCRPVEPELQRGEATEPREDRLEGRNPILEALRAGREIEKLWYLRDGEGSSADPALRRLVTAVSETAAVLQPVDRATLDRLSCTRNHQGVIAQVSLLPTVELEDLLAVAREKGEDPFLLVADEIQDSYNLGALFRIAEAAGVHGIVIPRRRQVGLDAVTARASAGAIHHVPCARVTNLCRALEQLKAAGLWIAGTTMEAEPVFDNRQLTGPLALVIGNEGKGMSPLVRRTCDFLVSIPMRGRLNSLNAAVAAGICVFEAIRLRTQHRGPASDS